MREKTYDQLKAEYQRILTEIDVAILEKKSYERLIDDLMQCICDIENTPEAKEERKKLFQEIEQGHDIFSFF